MEPDISYRYFFDAGLPIMPFLSFSLGFQRVQEITVTMLATERIGTLGMERINDVANRWTMPIMGGIYVKF